MISGGVALGSIGAGIKEKLGFIVSGALGGRVGVGNGGGVGGAPSPANRTSMSILRGEPGGVTSASGVKARLR